VEVALATIFWLFSVKPEFVPFVKTAWDTEIAPAEEVVSV
jgi:hypothetical protein